MEYNLTSEQWKEIKTLFSAWQEVNERAAELKAEKSDISKHAASIMQAKATDANKLFKNMQQKWDGKTPECEEISSMMSQMEANGGGMEVEAVNG